MESQSNDQPSQPIDPVAALQVAHEAQSRMAARVRSAWWVHVLRGLSIVATVVGLAGRPSWASWLLPLGVIGLALLARWRTREVGLSRANPDRWSFLTLGAPWSTIALVVAVAAMAFVVFVRSAPDWQVAVAAGVAGVVTAAFGPLADQAARAHLVDATAGGAGR
ncbi:hypothetical protein ACPEEZ_12090 [Frigoribacterium sp. 2-23]|uniref:hypothetical protein n=1 Tax=Frigoribacterium sp. 2-23 TaxID=3415006 RepID=UPI003C704F7F